MKLDWKRKFIKWLLLFSIVIMVVGVFAVFLLQRDATRQSKEFQLSSEMASGKGISLFESHGDKKVYRVTIDTFSANRAKLGPFAIGPMIVANLSKVTVDLYLEGIESKLESQKKEKGEGKITEWVTLDLEGPISNIRKNLPSKIKIVKLTDISFNLWKNEKRIFTISSDTATIDRKTGDIIFTGRVNMDSSENGNLISHRIRWDRETGLFKIIDPYILTKRGKKMEGKGIKIDYSLKKVIKLVSKKIDN